MKKTMTALLIVGIFGLALMVNACAMGSKSNPETMARYDNLKGLVGTEVRNPGGEVLGSISDLVSDREGHMFFAVITHDGRDVAIPYNALKISGTEPGEMKAVLNIDEQKLEGAPEFDQAKAMADRNWAKDVYRYFGLRPYWAEEQAPPAAVPGSGGVGY